MSYSYKYNPISDAFNLVGGQSSLAISLNQCVFKQTFTGNGSDTQFQLNGTENATFTDGSSWASAKILNSLPSYITKTNKGAIYDSINIFTRNRITVSSINASGLVTLSHVPRDTQQFIIWYWYDLATTDTIDDYYREDFVTTLEGEKPVLIATDITFSESQTVKQAIDDLASNIHTQNTDTQLDSGVLAIDGSDNLILTQNSVVAFKSENTGALVNTLYLKEGNVGIGTNNPSEKLDIKLPPGNGWVALKLDGRYSTYNESIGRIIFANQSVPPQASPYAMIECRVGENNSYGSQVAFWTAPAGSGSSVERMIINSVGNVGIGVTPTQKLDVAGNIKLTGDIKASTNFDIHDGTRNRIQIASNATYIYSPDGNVSLSVFNDSISSLGNFRPNTDNSKSLGISGTRWTDLWLSGNLNDGTNSLTIANVKTAYDHSQIVGGNSVHVSTTENTNWDTAYSHVSLTNNPHAVSKSQVGLGNVPNINFQTSLTIDERITHTGDTDTYIKFDTNSIEVYVGGQREFDIFEGLPPNSFISIGSGLMDIIFNFPKVFIGGSEGNYNGRVGINHVQPATLLDVAGTGNLIRISDSTDSYNERVILGNWTGGGGLEIYDSATVLQTKIRGYAINDIQGYFLAGNIGIGTDIPSEKLEVVGNIKISAGTSYDGDLLIEGTFSAPAQPACRVYTTAGQQITFNSWTTVNWEWESYNTGFMHNRVVNNPRIIANGDGKYLVTASVTFDYGSADTGIGIRIEKNGITQVRRFLTQLATSNRWASVQISDVLDLVDGDYIEISVWQDAPVARNLLPQADRNHFTMTKIT